MTTLEQISYRLPADEGQAIRDLIEENRKMRDALGLLQKEFRANADGTILKCVCGRGDCHKLNLTSGDEVYRVSYFHADKFHQALEEMKREQ